MQIWFIMFYTVSCKLCSQLSHFVCFLNADTSPTYLYTAIGQYEYKIYLIHLISSYCKTTLKSMFCFNWTLEFFCCCLFVLTTASYFVWLYQRREYFIDTYLPHVLQNVPTTMSTILFAMYWVCFISMYACFQSMKKTIDYTRELSTKCF